MTRQRRAGAGHRESSGAPPTPPLLPQTKVLWRAADVVQLETGPHRVVVENVNSADVAWLLSGQVTSTGHAGRAATIMGMSGPQSALAATTETTSDPLTESAVVTSDWQPTPSGASVIDRSVGSLAELRLVLSDLGIAERSLNEGQCAPVAERLRSVDSSPQDGLAQLPPPARWRPAPGLPGADRCPAYRNAELLSLQMRGRQRAEHILDRRSGSAVTVHGRTRIAATVAATLAAAGVGFVSVADDGEASAALACPGGLLPDDEGRRFTDAAAAAIARAAPGTETGSRWPSVSANLVVLTDPRPVSDTLRTSLHLQGLPYLRVWVDGQQAQIGPLVRPGVTSCLRCADLHRLDRDPAWSLLAVQLMQPPRHRPASDSALCVAAAGVAGSQALAFLDGEGVASEGATLEWQLPDWRLRRRSWPVHAECGCAEANTGAGAAE